MWSRDEEAEGHANPHLSEVDCLIFEHDAEQVCENDLDGSNDEAASPVEGKNILKIAVRIDREENPQDAEDSHQNNNRRFSQ